MNILLPNSYRNFLSYFGIATFNAEEVYGLSEDKFIGKGKDYLNIISLMLEYRDDREMNFHHSYIPIYKLGNGEITRLDTSRINKEGELPVVSWYFGNSEDIFEDFRAFLLDLVKNSLENN